MPDKKKYVSAEDFLKDPTGDIAKLRKMGITDYAIITYVVRVQEGKSKEEALRGLLLGRSLTSAQIEFIRRVLESFPARRSAEAGYVLLEPALVGALDYIFDSERVFFGGLLLIASPLATGLLFGPLAILFPMMFGVICAAAAVLIESDCACIPALISGRKRMTIHRQLPRKSCI